jgi:hypothetical protein
MNDESLTPAEARAAGLLADLRTAEPPQHRDLAAAVAHDARWQRQVRHVLVSIGAAANGIAGGLGVLARRRP